MTFDTDVLVIGGGPVGLTLANELIRHGASARVVDMAPAIREVSKALILHVRTQEALDKVGIAEAARSEARPLTEVVVHAYGKPIGSWDLDEIDSPYRCPLILGQNRTQHLLLDLLVSRGSGVEWKTEATDIQIHDDGVETILRAAAPDGGTREERVRSRYVVGCEGSNSLVRKTLGLTFEGDRYTGEQFIQADCRISWALPKGRSYLFLTAAGYLMVIEFPGDIVRIFMSLPDASSTGAREASGELGAAESATEIPTLEDIRENLVRLTGFDCALSDPRWLARYRTSHRYANRFGRGRAFVAGDAGHVHVPIGGQGMNTGIQDAFNLGWKLAGVVAGRLRETVLESYDAERHPVAENLIRGTNFAYTGILHPSEIKQRAVRWFGPYLIGNARVQSFMRETLEELRISYPDSPLNLDLGGASGPKPGERVLDTVFVRASDGETVTLNALTRGVNWTLLLFSGAGNGAVAPSAGTARFPDTIAVYRVIADRRAPVGAGEETVLIDALAIAHERYGVSAPAFLLLRPDTYIAARGPIARLDALAGHLAGIFAGDIQLG